MLAALYSSTSSLSSTLAKLPESLNTKIDLLMQGIKKVTFTYIIDKVHQYAIDGRKGISGSSYGPTVIRFAGHPILKPFSSNHLINS